MAENSYTTFEIAQFCEVTMRAVTQWIDQGKLAAHKTPGGHRRVQVADLLAFLKKYQMPVPPALQSANRPRVLIVDDDKALLSLLRRSLEKIEPELEIEVATDGFEAGEKVAFFLPDLVLLDIRLPGIDGFKVCSKIKSQKVKDIKIMAMSGDQSTDVENQILDCGADRYLAKPFDMAKLQDEVKQLLGFGAPRFPLYG